LFSQEWLEKHGNASFQDCWSFTELDGPLSSRQEGLSEGLYRQDQIGCKQDSMASVWDHPGRCLKFYRGNDEAGTGKIKGPGIPGANLELFKPWWKALDISMSLD